MFRPTTCVTMINREFVTPPKEFRRIQDAEDYLGQLQIYSNAIGATEIDSIYIMLKNYLNEEDVSVELFALPDLIMNKKNSQYKVGIYRCVTAFISGIRDHNL